MTESEMEISVASMTAGERRAALTGWRIHAEQVRRWLYHPSGLALGWQGPGDWVALRDHLAETEMKIAVLSRPPG